MQTIKQLFEEYGVRWFEKTYDQDNREYDGNPFDKINWPTIYEIMNEPKFTSEKRKDLIKEKIMFEILNNAGRLGVVDSERFIKKVNLNEEMKKIPIEFWKMVSISYWQSLGKITGTVSKTSLRLKEIARRFETDEADKEIQWEKSYKGNLKKTIDQLVPEYRIMQVFDPEAQKYLKAEIEKKNKKTNHRN